MTPAALADEVRRAFADDGPLAAAGPGFEPRAGQRRLAAEVAGAIAEGGTLLAEAGTGTGKTLAYLVPAVLSGRKVLISTGTRTLQEQVFFKDVPALAAALGRDIRAACMKGRANYLCLHRFERLREAEAGLDPADRAWLARIAAWADETDSGDRSEVEDLPDSFPLWADLSATGEQCLGRDCPQYAACWVTRMRDRAAEADLVIVNHHLLCADASVRQGAFGAVIPECDVAIVDEAHQLEDVVTQYFGVMLSATRLEAFGHDVGQALAAVPAGRARYAIAVRRAADEVQAAGRRVFDTARLEVGRPDGSDRVTIAPDVAGRLHDVGLALTGALDALTALLRRPPEPSDDLAALAVRTRDLAADVRLLVSAGDERFVHFIETRGRGVLLRAAPIEVGDLVRDHVLGGRHATVLTSATLAVAGSFDYVSARLGLAGARAISLPSEFDFRTQAVLYLPPEMPDPRAPEFNAAAAWTIAGLLDRTRGRAFVLFTSHAAMREVYERVERRVSWPILLQGTAPRLALLRDFRATPHAVLFATSSFWQGVDVAGEALSCVIIDRLPFASPGDPIVAARIAAIERRGGHPFHDYQVPLATLTLLQGLGRLIRTRRDRGVLAILDPRLTRMAYGRRFLASLPPAPVTDDLGVVGSFIDSG